MEGLLRKLCTARGVSGFENDISALLEEELDGHVDKIYRDGLGNLIMEKEGVQDGPRVMLVAHMDEIGGMVKYVDDKGFLYFVDIGSHNPQQLLGNRVVIGNGVNGVIQKKSKDNEFKIGDLYIDVGANGKEDLDELGIGVGSIITRAPLYDKLLGERRISKSFDNRSGVCVMAELIREIKDFKGTIIAVASVQEEVGTRGAKVVSNTFDADIAIALDVTFAVDTPQRSSDKDANTYLGKGPAITLKDDYFILQTRMREFIERVAREKDIPLQYDISKGGTDAGPLYTSKGSTPTAAVLVPLRYMHTGNEIIDLDDMRMCVALLKGIVEGIDSYGL